MEMANVFELFVNGAPAAMVNEITLEIRSGDKVVKTLKLGTAGYSDGAHDCTISFKSAIPLAGREIDYKAFVINHQTLKLGVKGGSTQLIAEGRLMTVSESSSVDNPVEISGSFEGRILSNS